MEARYVEVVQSVLATILSDVKSCYPRYRADIKSEAQAETLPGLPLVCTWNEVFEGDQVSWSLSVNGTMIGEMLERSVPRSDPNFIAVRDQIMKSLSETQNELVVRLCQNFNWHPRQLNALLAGN